MEQKCQKHEVLEKVHLSEKFFWKHVLVHSLSLTFKFEANRATFVKNPYFDFWTLKFLIASDNLLKFQLTGDRPSFPG